MNKLIAIFESDSKMMHLFFFFEKTKLGREGDLSWCLPPKRDHSDTLSAGPKPMKAGDPDEP